MNELEAQNNCFSKSLDKICKGKTNYQWCDKLFHSVVPMLRPLQISHVRSLQLNLSQVSISHRNMRIFSVHQH